MLRALAQTAGSPNNRSKPRALHGRNLFTTAAAEDKAAFRRPAKAIREHMRNPVGLVVAEKPLYYAPTGRSRQKKPPG